jgi:hypothetical protein
VTTDDVLNRAIDASEPAEVLWIAVGIPQGVVLDPQSQERFGAVRRGGEVVFVDVADYALWTQLLVPRSQPAMADDLHGAMARLQELGLLVEFDSWESAIATVGSLRPLPLAAGLGNAQAGPNQFQVRSAGGADAPLVALEPIENLLWWEFDGGTVVQGAAARIATLTPGVEADTVSTIAVRLVLKLMANRLVYLDSAI